MAINYAKTVGLVKMPPTVKIGNIIYPLLRLGDYEIMGTTVREYGTADTDYKIYNGKYYYKTDNLNSLFASQLSDGFIFPDNSVFQNIYNALTGTENERALKMMGFFSDSWPGNNETGLTLEPLGYKSSYGFSGAPDYYGSLFACGLPNSYGSTQKISYNGTKLVFTTSWAWGNDRGVPVRLARHV